MLETDFNSIILTSAKNCIEQETNALISLKECINDQFIKVVKLIFSIKGRVVITGIGKSAIVGQKIVATLNSTGTPSLFMHAADAIHGDLGMVQNEDAVICISKSGETPEIKVLIPLIKMRKVPLIGISSNNSSALAVQSDEHIFIPHEKEADPNNLAPTSSTTAQMALGDALAVCLLQLKGFSSANFAEFHPGGALGKQLYLDVAYFSTRHSKPYVRPNESLQKVLLSMSSGRMGATAVVSDDEQLLGIITDGDIRRLMENRTDFRQITAAQIMSRSPKTIQIRELAASTLKMMRESSVSQLIVLDHTAYSGMIHIHDLIKEGIL